MFLAAILLTSLLQDPAPPAPAPKPPPLKVIALVGGTVHTMVASGAEVAPAQVATVLLQGNRILAVGPSIEIPADAVRVDVTGKHVIPGLIDGLVNHDADHDRLYVTSGVTLVGAPPSTTSAVVLDTPEKAEENLGRLFALDLDFLSFHAGLSEPVWRRVIQIGHEGKLQVWGPKLPGVDAAKIAASGQDGLYHLEAFLPEGKGWTDVTFDDLKPGIEAFTGKKSGERSAKKIAVTPTLAVFAKRLIDPPKV